MTYRGHVRNGVIVLDDAVPLEEGAEVRVEIETKASQEQNLLGVPLAQRLARVIGKASDLPQDWSLNHDDYLRRTYRQ